MNGKFATETNYFFKACPAQAASACFQSVIASQMTKTCRNSGSSFGSSTAALRVKSPSGETEPICVESSNSMRSRRNADFARSVYSRPECSMKSSRATFAAARHARLRPPQIRERTKIFHDVPCKPRPESEARPCRATMIYPRTVRLTWRRPSRRTSKTTSWELLSACLLL